jgi:hypothetical protein
VLMARPSRFNFLAMVPPNGRFMPAFHLLLEELERVETPGLRTPSSSAGRPSSWTRSGRLGSTATRRIPPASSPAFCHPCSRATRISPSTRDTGSTTSWFPACYVGGYRPDRPGLVQRQGEAPLRDGIRLADDSRTRTTLLDVWQNCARSRRSCPTARTISPGRSISGGLRRAGALPVMPAGTLSARRGTAVEPPQRGEGDLVSHGLQGERDYSRPSVRAERPS